MPLKIDSLTVDNTLQVNGYPMGNKEQKIYEFTPSGVMKMNETTFNVVEQPSNGFVDGNIIFSLNAGNDLFTDKNGNPVTFDLYYAVPVLRQSNKIFSFIQKDNAITSQVFNLNGPFTAAAAAAAAGSIGGGVTETVLQPSPGVVESPSLFTQVAGGYFYIQQSAAVMLEEDRNYPKLSITTYFKNYDFANYAAIPDNQPKEIKE